MNIIFHIKLPRVLNSFIFLFVFFTNCYSQQFRVLSLRQVSDDVSSDSNLASDCNGTAGALLKIDYSENGIQVAGNVIGNILFDGKSYLVNIAEGTKKITIAKKKVKPLTLMFSQYGIKVQSKHSYELKLDVITINNEISGQVDGHDYVDLGLSVNWATYNVGASNIKELGIPYKYGETVPYQEDRPYTIMEAYGFADFVILTPKQDVAHVKWGGNWRMPTSREFDELEKQCTKLWTTKDGVLGIQYTAKNGNKLFLPTSTWIEGERCALYWTNGFRHFDMPFSISNFLVIRDFV